MAAAYESRKGGGIGGLEQIDGRERDRLIDWEWMDQCQGQRRSGGGRGREQRPFTTRRPLPNFVSPPASLSLCLSLSLFVVSSPLLSSPLLFFILNTYTLSL
jgi:hypothetical protein